MDEKLYYEVNVTTSTDIKNAYEHAIENNIKNYRCIAKDGSIYGWGDGKYTKAQTGQEWFENPEYKEPIPVADAAIESGAFVEPAINKTTEEVASQEVSTKEKEIDYKALYEQSQEILAKTQDELANWVKAYNTVKEELDEIKNAFTTIAKEFKEANDKTE